MNLTYQDAVDKTDALHALGETEIYLHSGNYPWELVTRCEKGGSHRLDINTSVWFTAYNPDVKLYFKWSFDIEERSASKGTYFINVEACEKVLALLNKDARKEFQQYLLECAVQVDKSCKELHAHVTREMKTVSILNRLGSKE